MEEEHPSEKKSIKKRDDDSDLFDGTPRSISVDIFNPIKNNDDLIAESFTKIPIDKHGNILDVDSEEAKQFKNLLKKYLMHKKFDENTTEDIFDEYINNLVEGNSVTYYTNDVMDHILEFENSLAKLDEDKGNHASFKYYQNKELHNGPIVSNVVSSKSLMNLFNIIKGNHDLKNKVNQYGLVIPIISGYHFMTVQFRPDGQVVIYDSKGQDDHKQNDRSKSLESVFDKKQIKELFNVEEGKDFSFSHGFTDKVQRDGNSCGLIVLDVVEKLSSNQDILTDHKYYSKLAIKKRLEHLENNLFPIAAQVENHPQSIHHISLNKFKKSNNPILRNHAKEAVKSALKNVSEKIGDEEYFDFYDEIQKGEDNNLKKDIDLINRLIGGTELKDYFKNSKSNETTLDSYVEEQFLYMSMKQTLSKNINVSLNNVSMSNLNRDDKRTFIQTDSEDNKKVIKTYRDRKKFIKTVYFFQKASDQLIDLAHPNWYYDPKTLTTEVSLKPTLKKLLNETLTLPQAAEIYASVEKLLIHYLYFKAAEDKRPEDTYNYEYLRSRAQQINFDPNKIILDGDFNTEFGLYSYFLSNPEDNEKMFTLNDFEKKIMGKLNKDADSKLSIEEFRNQVIRAKNEHLVRGSSSSSSMEDSEEEDYGEGDIDNGSENLSKKNKSEVENMSIRFSQLSLNRKRTKSMLEKEYSNYYSKAHSDQESASNKKGYDNGNQNIQEKRMNKAKDKLNDDFFPESQNDPLPTTKKKEVGSNKIELTKKERQMQELKEFNLPPIMIDEADNQYGAARGPLMMMEFEQDLEHEELEGQGMFIE